MMNRKGQFSIIAAMLVAVVLIAAVMTTYSTIRYNSATEQPQILSAVDETNLGIKEMLGFTVGYYGSVLKVTGNMTYAQQLATNYLKSGLTNIGEIRPEWGTSFELTNLNLNADWFSNMSYSQGTITVNYNLTGLGISGVSYSTSSKLEVDISNASSPNQAQLTILRDEGQPLINLGRNNLNFYTYDFAASNWALTPPTTIASYANGSYVIDLPLTLLSSSYVIQVEDTRGLMVLASSFSEIISTVAWNTTGFKLGFDYADAANSIVGTHSNFAAQQNTPDGNFDTLTEQAAGLAGNNYYPLNYNLLGMTTRTSGALADLQSNDEHYMQFHAYPTAYSASTESFGFGSKGGTGIALNNIKGSRFTCPLGGLANSISAYLHYTASSGTFGNTASGISSQSIVDIIRGQRFTSPNTPVVVQDIKAYLDTSTALGNTATGSSSVRISNNIAGSPYTATEAGTVQSISAYLDVTNTGRSIKAAIYSTGGVLLGSTDEVTGLSGGAQWVVMPFSGSKPSLTAGTTYILVVWANQSGSNYVNLFYSGTLANAGVYKSQSYGAWPTPTTLPADNNRYCIYASYTTAQTHNVKAAIYQDNPATLIATSQEVPVSGIGWATFTFASPPTLAASTNYELVVWAQSGSGNVNLCYSSGTGGNGRSVNQAYGSWPASPSFTTDTRQYSIYCDYNTAFKAQAAIYSANGGSRLETTEEKILSTIDNWVTFNFNTQPVLLSTTDYVLTVWCSDASVSVYYNAGGAEMFEAAGTYPTWPASVIDQSSLRNYSLYCTYTKASEYTAKIEFTGTSDSVNWQQLIWSVDSCITAGTATYTLQLYNYAASQYPLDGGGYQSAASLGTSDVMRSQTINLNPTNFKDGTTNWKLVVTAVSTTATPFDLKVDLVQYNPQFTNYALNLEEQWLTVNAANVRQDLCIKTGTLGSEPLIVQVFHGGSWTNLMTLAPNYFNNVSLAPYIDSSTLTIRFVGYNDTKDPTPTSWEIDSVYIKDEPDPNFLIKLQQSCFTLEILQNGTMHWLGQNVQSTSQTLPVPPVPVKAIHVNETIEGVNQEVPFQVEDWASNYQVPLGLTSNTTVFSNRQMIVLLLDSRVSDFTIWWDGSDNAVQTPLAFTPTCFSTDDTGAATLSNGKLTLQFTGGSVKSTVAGTTTSSTANFMRVNQQASTYGAGFSYVIHHGIVRDVVQQESEWSRGISQTLYVDSFSSTSTGWTTYGTSPYLNDNDNNRIYSNVDGRVEGWFGFQDLSINGFGAVAIEFECITSGDDYIQFQVNDGVNTYGWFDVKNLPSSYGRVSYDLSSIITSVSQLNNLRVNIKYVQVGGSASTINVRRCDLHVTTVPNVYANMVITLPANSNYYTYQLRLMFITSSQQRTITDLCPIQVTPSITPDQTQTEDGTQNGFPVISNGAGTYFNSAGSGGWTAHHFSQLITNNGKGVGIMFAGIANQRLYAFDSFSGSTSKGALKASSSLLELLPVSQSMVQFSYAYDVTWIGAVATWDGTTPMCTLYDGTTPTGLWLLAEYPPTITITAKS